MDAIDILSIVLILIATSNVFGYCLTYLKVPDLAAKAITNITDNPIILALLINLILLLLGMIMDMAPIILIATPILLPLAQSIGITPIQFGIIIILNCGIGLLTPPIGAVLFIGSAVSKQPIEKIVKATLPFYLCMLITLLLVPLFPESACCCQVCLADRLSSHCTICPAAPCRLEAISILTSRSAPVFWQDRPHGLPYLLL